MLFHYVFLAIHNTLQRKYIANVASTFLLLSDAVKQVFQKSAIISIRLTGTATVTKGGAGLREKVNCVINQQANLYSYGAAHHMFLTTQTNNLHVIRGQHTSPCRQYFKEH